MQGFCRSDVPCSFATDCASGFVCRNATCTRQANAECIPGIDLRCAPYRCDPAAMCLVSCTTDYDCAPGNACLGGGCFATECSQTAPCGSGYRCESGACIIEPRGLNSSCSRDAECTSQRCCLEPDLGLLCMRSCGDAPLNAPCGFGVECESGNCVSGLCTDCSGGDCTPTLFCDAVECGVYRGTDCGGCDGLSYCEDNHCVLGCTQQECGDDHGIVCGECDGAKVCSGGACVEPTCTPGTFFCGSDGSDILRCVDGIATTVFDTCQRTQVCRAGATECASFVCAANQGFCEGDLHFGCDASSQRIVQPPRDCADEGKRCLPAASCVSQHVDTLEAPVPQTLVDQNVCGNVYSVTKDVTLVEIGQQQGQSGAPEIWWFLYRADELAGPYELVVPRITAPPRIDAGEVSSPLLSLPLEAGAFYFIGFAANGTNFVADANGETPQAVSFGSMIQGACSPDGMPQTLEQLTLVGVVPQTLTTY